MWWGDFQEQMGACKWEYIGKLKEFGMDFRQINLCEKSRQGCVDRRQKTRQKTDCEECRKAEMSIFVMGCRRK